MGRFLPIIILFFEYKIKVIIFQYVSILQILKKQPILITQALNSTNNIRFVGVLGGLKTDKTYG
ncbi:hypothetical protein, partial [Bartonella sp. AP58NXGY]|uniref:hypothetical protein n=1 Tax=Bartonella sp. AP58NXGY TaxID=3243498 RepID=UPI0035D0A767